MVIHKHGQKCVAQECDPARPAFTVIRWNSKKMIPGVKNQNNLIERQRSLTATEALAGLCHLTTLINYNVLSSQFVLHDSVIPIIIVGVCK